MGKHGTNLMLRTSNQHHDTFVWLCQHTFAARYAGMGSSTPCDPTRIIGYKK